MNDKMITVVVPVYNMGKYLEKSIYSLLKQTYRNYEIVIVDDGSTDNSAQLSDALARKHSVIRTVHKANGGLSSARNRGIDEAKGDYIVFPDPDDWVDEQYLESFVKQISESSDLEICGNYVVTENNTTVQNQKADATVYSSKEAILHLLAQKEYCGFAWNKLYHLDIIREKDLRFDEELGMAQDLHFAFRYILQCRNVSYNPEPHYYYVQHEAGVTNINHPLTTRKISGLKTYQKLYELSETYVPEAVPVVGATIANQNLSFLYIYYNSDMNNPELQRMLYSNFKAYKKYFFANQNYDMTHKAIGAIALVSPRLFFRLKKLKNGGR